MAGALWGEREANRWVYIGNREDRGTEVPRPRKSGGFSPNRLSLDQRIDVSSRGIEEDGGREQDRNDQIELPSTPTTLASEMAGLPDENLIELLLHLKVRTRPLSYPALILNLRQKTTPEQTKLILNSAVVLMVLVKLLRSLS